MTPTRVVYEKDTRNTHSVRKLSPTRPGTYAPNIVVDMKIGHQAEAVLTRSRKTIHVIAVE